VSDDEPDLGEAADYILAERPKLAEDDVWAVLRELREPPPAGSDGLALQLLKSTSPHVRPRHAKVILREWRAYLSLVRERDWEDDEL
jgi:hypothetical protein